MATSTASALKVGDWYKPDRGWWWWFQVEAITASKDKLRVVGKFPKGAWITLYFKPTEKVEIR